MHLVKRIGVVLFEIDCWKSKCWVPCFWIFWKGLEPSNFQNLGIPKPHWIPWFWKAEQDKKIASKNSLGMVWCHFACQNVHFWWTICLFKTKHPVLATSKLTNTMAPVNFTMHEHQNENSIQIRSSWCLVTVAHCWAEAQCIVGQDLVGGFTQISLPFTLRVLTPQLSSVNVGGPIKPLSIISVL